MFDKVLVGVDGHEGGRDAIALARRLIREGGELTLAHVSPSDPYVPRRTTRDHESAERAEALLEQARDEANVGAQVRWGQFPSVGRGLHELAELIDADLLVIGSSRHGLLGPVLIGDDTRAALNGAPCAVAIAPAGYRQRSAPIRIIGVGYDASPESEHALGVARTLATQLGVKLSALEALALPAYLLEGAGPADEMIDRSLALARERIAALGNVEPHAGYGDAAEELALYGDSVDLLVVGSRGYGPIGRLVHGSTSQRLVRTARCPLLVLTRAVRNADRRAVAALPGVTSA